MEAPPRRVLLLALVLLASSLIPLAPSTGAEHASPSDPPTPHRTTAHPAYGYPTVNDPTCQATPDLWTPPAVDLLPTPVREITRSASPEPQFEGTGLAVFGGLAIVAGREGGNHVFDIRDPDDPTHLAGYGNETRDVQTLAFPDCRLYAVQAGEFPDERVEVFNLTDPENPANASRIQPPDGTHNTGIVPGTPILYNANSRGGGTGWAMVAPQGSTEIYDLSNPEDPELVKEWDNGYGCHDITFHIDPAQDVYRAYCAGVEATQIWDVADPTDPSVVATVPYPHGDRRVPTAGVTVASFSHLAMVSDDGDTLIVGDETGGGLAPACDVHAEVGSDSVSGPAGNLYFYDVSDEQAPELEGFFSPSSGYLGGTDRIPVYPTCTAHFGRVLGTRDVAAVAFYTGGVVLVDFTDPEEPVLVDRFANGDAYWDAWSYRGKVYGGNMDAGLDVFELG